MNLHKPSLRTKAQVTIKDFDWNRDYYAYVCIGGYVCYSRRLRAWKLYSLTIREKKSVMLSSLAGSTLGVWVSHGEGRFCLPHLGDK